MSENKYTVLNVVHALIGPTMPLGEAHSDNVRYENLKNLCELVDSLLGDIHSVALCAERHEASISRAGRYAADFLREVKEAD